jgi:PAS domain S-box-containing protein
VATKQKKQVPIKELTDLQRALDESAIVAITDQTGRITYVNEKFCEIAKYTRDELIGQDHRIINSGYHTKEFIRNIWTTIAKGGVWRGELRNRAKDGSIYWVDTTIVPFLDKNDKPFQYVAIRYETTERKLGEERISQQASLLDKAQDAILVCDLNSQILYWNKGAESIYGSSSDDVFGRKLGDVVCGGDPEYIRQAEEALKAADEWKTESRHTTHAGDNIIVESRWALVRNDKGEPDYYFVTNTDITEQKRTEEHLFRAQRMESIGTLAGGIAHDLNNILSPIMMAVDMLNLNDTGPEEKRWLGMIKESAERGSDLVNQVLTFARGMSGEHIPVQLKHIVKDLVGVLNETLPKSISVKYDIAADLWTISADPTQIHQILMNVCINARDAMPSGGTLTIKAENVAIDENYARMNLDAAPGSYVLLTVDDTGTGMPAEVIKRIFDPFFTTKEIGKGTGLGLATTLTIVKSHGGFINVYSEPKRGTKFSIYLSSAEERSEKADAVAKDALPRGNGELVLIVDDEKNIRNVAEATLSKFGYRTLTAVDGTDALAVYSQRTKDIAAVLTDMAMPFLDGEALIRALKKMNPEIKVIAMSGLASKGTAAKLTTLNVSAFLSKPFSAETLLKTLKELFT